jgi:hypothetical protein
LRKLRIISVGAIAGIALVVATVAVRARKAMVPASVLAPLATPADDDRSDLCADVGEIRACWGEPGGLEGPACDGRACVVKSPLPSGSAPASGWRCGGTRQARVCEERTRNAGPWQCDGGRCVQRAPRLPDDGEWSCVDQAGGVYCHGGGPAAGVVAAGPDLGWVCGARKGGAPGERVCVDFAPDEPPLGEPTKCHYEYPIIAPERICVSDRAPRLGDVCEGRQACPSGASCTGGHCLPPRPEPSCWFDADCGSGARCRWASCVVEASR